MPMIAKEFLPVELIFMPNWWHRHYGIAFDQSFYLDKETRIANEQRMNAILHQRFGQMGLGEVNPQRHPIIGSKHVAGGFVMPALMGCQIQFSPDQSPWPNLASLDDAQVMALQVPDIQNTWPMQDLIADMDTLEQEFGYVEGDFDIDGVINLALHLRGQQLFVDMVENPTLAHHLFDVCARTMAEVAEYVKRRTGTCAIATDRMIVHVDETIFLHSNCSVQMISPQHYQEFLLKSELYLASRLQPYGIHHCGARMEGYSPAYAQVPSAYFDIGWEADFGRCRELLPEAFFNLRLSPTRMQFLSPAEIAADTEKLLRSCPRLERAGISCINMDYATPDENIWAMYEVVERYRHYGA